MMKRESGKSPNIYCDYDGGDCDRCFPIKTYLPSIRDLPGNSSSRRNRQVKRQVRQGKEYTGG